ncbi:glycosyltransferase [Cetobacterium sp.]|uniref:glycosyltransferase n=1 Tax=Cetobacterium sp. TaxID=2071632 RepID=UPI003F328097
MKIVYIEDCFNPTALYQINEILKQPHGKFEKVLITSDDMKPFHKEYSKNEDFKFSQKYGVKIIRLPVIFSKSGRRWIKGLYKEIEKESADIVYMHGIADFKDIINIFKPKKNILFRDCHMSWSATTQKYANLFYYICKNFIFKPLNFLEKYDRIYSLGIEEREYLDAIGIKKEKIEDFIHGYNKDDYYFSLKEREKFRKENQISKDEIIIGYIGKLDDTKKPHINLKILKLMEDKYLEENRIKFLFLGPQDSKYMSEKFNKKYDEIINKHKPIILEGRRASDLREVYNGVDICLWPKQTTLSSIHAQACQSTVIMENETSNKERVIENKNLYEISNLEEAVIKIKDIIDNKKYLKEKNEWYLEKIKDREYTYQISKKIKEWEKLVEEKRGKK